jgi:hypothetical protein
MEVYSTGLITKRATMAQILASWYWANAADYHQFHNWLSLSNGF